MVVMTKGYDKIGVNYEALLDLPFSEGSGLITRDIAKPHHEDVVLVGPPTWVQTPLSNLTVLDFNGVTNYLESSNLGTVDLDFQVSDYSLVCWVCPVDTGTSEVLIGRYHLDVSGWEVYFTNFGWEGYMTLRHHHASLGPDLRDGCYSMNWLTGVWQCLGISRHGLYPVHYRNGVALPMSYEASGMQNPDTCAQDLVIGARYTKNATFYKGQIWRMRVLNRALGADEMREIFEVERKLFGV